MCNCIAKAEEAAMVHLKEKSGENMVESGHLLHVGYSFGKVSYRATYNEFEYQFTPKKKDGTFGKTIKKQLSIYHSHCPYCGEKYVKDAEEPINEAPCPTE